MIKQLKKREYGYDISKSSNREWQQFCKWFQESERIDCIICNDKTCHKFKEAFKGLRVIVIFGDKIPDNVVYINNVR